MNIKYKDECVEFNSIRIGDFFRYSGFLYLKTDSSNSRLNAFNCDKETIASIKPESLVHPINIELHEV